MVPKVSLSLPSKSKNINHIFKGPNVRKVITQLIKYRNPCSDSNKLYDKLICHICYSPSILKPLTSLHHPIYSSVAEVFWLNAICNTCKLISDSITFQKIFVVEERRNEKSFAYLIRLSDVEKVNDSSCNEINRIMLQSTTGSSDYHKRHLMLLLHLRVVMLGKESSKISFLYHRRRLQFSRHN